MVLAPAFVLLSDHNADAPALAGICTVSKDTDKPGWDHGAYEIGVARAKAGAFWVDRPYRPGAIDAGWMVGRCREVTGAGGWCQAGNEPRQEWPGGLGPYLSCLTDCVGRYPEGAWVLGPLGDPLTDEWRADMADPGYLALGAQLGRVACHAYGNFEQTQEAVQAYLDAFPAAEIVVTEANFGAGNKVDVGAWAENEWKPFLSWCASQQRVRLVGYFAWRWDKSKGLPTPVDAAGTAVEQAITNYRSTPVGLKVADISDYQGQVDMSGWKAAGVEGVVVRISEDGCPPDPFAPGNVAQTRKEGLLLGGYHLSHPDICSPAQSLTNFQNGIAAAGGWQPGDIPVHDSELGAVAQMATWCAEFGALLYRQWLCRALMYSAPWWLGPNGLEIDGVAVQYGGLWEANYTGDPTFIPSKVPGWDKLVMVQYTASGTLPGVNGPVDLSTFLGSRDAWLALGIPTPAVSVDPVTDAENNLFDLTLQTGAVPDARRRQAQAALEVLKEALAKSA